MMKEKYYEETILIYFFNLYTRCLEKLLIHNNFAMNTFANVIKIVKICENIYIYFFLVFYSVAN